MSRLASPWRPFASWGTLLSASLVVAPCGVAWSPAAGVLVALLLYAHEAGHLLAAAARGLLAGRAPFIVPGLALFTVIPRADAAPVGARAWDEALVLLGGPIVGGGLALAAKLAGIAWGLPALALAGEVCLLFNLVTLLPLGPLDGGEIVGKTGLVGFGVSLSAGYYLYLHGHDLPGAALTFLTQGFLAFGVWRVYRAARGAPAIGALARFNILALYALAGLALVVALLDDEWVVSPAYAGPLLSSGTWALLGAVFLLHAFATVAWPYAWSRRRTAADRYLIPGLTYWSYDLVAAPWRALTLFLLGAHTIEWPTLRLLAALVRRFTRPMTSWHGMACALAYDCLSLERGRREDIWLARMAPALRAAGTEAVHTTYEQLVWLGYDEAANGWLAAALEDVAPHELSERTANGLAWALMRIGRPHEGLPFARSAVARAAGAPAYEDTLGRILFDLGAYTEAERALDRALRGVDYGHAGVQVTLARALAARGHHDEAAAEAEDALARHAGAWPRDEPRPDEVRVWLRRWRLLSRRRRLAHRPAHIASGLSWRPRRPARRVHPPAKSPSAGGACD